MTDQKIRITPYPLGAHSEADGIRFSFISEEENCGIILFDRNTGREIRKIPFLPQEKIGNIYCKYIPEADAGRISYQFYEGEHAVPDIYARAFTGNMKYGRKREEQEINACILTGEFNWEEDRNPRIPYENCINYCLHVRGFTRHNSSGVINRGTFAGMAEKLPYLKELGITTLEIQPAYEFFELPTCRELSMESREIPSAFRNSGPQSKEEGELLQPDQDVTQRINYWGYKKGYYYAPKAGYAAGMDPSLEFKEMVKEFHKNGMEIIMQFYFPKEVPKQDIPDILRFWIIEYHIDGFHLIGERIPVNMIAADPALTDTKLWYEDFAVWDLYGEKAPRFRNLAIYQDDYMYDMRRFLKGDEDMLPGILYHMRCNPEKTGRINYFTNYYGFTMLDLVSYERKHNEENGESNSDGNDFNLSWNCGAEGNCRKKKILSLRKKQIKNALSMLFLSQATPLLFMGDEFGNSQKGNNNPYCQDNDIAWLNWKDLEKNRDLYDFTVNLIRLRQEHPILHKKEEMRIMDYLSCGYPDLSYHGEKAWRPSLDYYDRHIGIMYCGKYVEKKHSTEDAFIYVALNMHWETQEFAMPRLPKGKKWELLLKTDDMYDINDSEGDTRDNWQLRKVPARSVAVFISVP